MRPTLLDLYEDLFQYLCRLNRMARTPARVAFERVRSDLEELLGQVAEKAGRLDASLQRQAAKMELPIIFFIDNLIATSSLPFAGQWSQNRLARERNELAGDEKFFSSLQDDLDDASEDATERLAVYQVCLGLGFTGEYVGQPQRIQKLMDQIDQRVRRLLSDNFNNRLSPKAYEHTDTRLLTEPASGKVVFLAILFAFLTLSTFVVYYGLYARAVSELTESVETINKQGRSPAAESFLRP